MAYALKSKKRQGRTATGMEAEKQPELAIGAQPEEKKEEEKKEEELPAGFPETRKQWEQSQEKKLEEIDKYREAISSFQVEEDARTLLMRSKVQNAQRLREEKLEIMAKSDLEDLKIMEEKCAEARAKETAQEMSEALIGLKQLGAEMIEDKKKVLRDLQREVREADIFYEVDLRRDADQIKRMGQKNQELKSSLRKFQRKELDQLLSSLLDEEKAFHLGTYKEWEQKRNEIPHKQHKHFLEMMKQKEEYEEQLDELRMKEINELTRMKQSLEVKADLLQLRLEKSKAANFLNDEKLEFSRQVVGFCEMEKSQVKSKQKRQLIKLYDTLKDLKAKSAQMKKQSLEEKKTLTDAYKRASQKYRDMQKRSRDFAAEAAKTYQGTRQTQEEEARDLVQRALNLEQLIHEQILGLDWVPPPMPFEEGSPNQQTEAENGTSESARTAVDPETSQGVLELLCEEASFLIDPHFLQLLTNVPKDQHLFMKLDRLCFALGVETTEDVQRLIKFFVEYKQQEETDSSDIVRPDQVVKVLKAFVDQYCKRPQGEDAVSQDSRDGSDYWERVASIFPESKFRLYEALEDALKQYLAVLSERAQALADTRQLKREIAKLRARLQEY